MHLCSSIEDSSSQPSQDVANSKTLPSIANSQAPEAFSFDEHKSSGPISVFNAASNCTTTTTNAPECQRVDEESYYHDTHFNSGSNRFTISKNDSDSDRELPNFSLFPQESNTSSLEKKLSDSFDRELYETNVTKHLREHLTVLLGGEDDMCKYDSTANRTTYHKTDQNDFAENRLDPNKDCQSDMNVNFNSFSPDSFRNREIAGLRNQTSNCSSKWNENRQSYNNEMEEKVGNIKGTNLLTRITNL